MKERNKERMEELIMIDRKNGNEKRKIKESK